jgi:hypothetical protein
VSPLKIKTPVKNFATQRCAEGLNSDVKKVNPSDPTQVTLQLRQSFQFSVNIFSGVTLVGGGGGGGVHKTFWIWFPHSSPFDELWVILTALYRYFNMSPYAEIDKQIH